MHSSIYPKYLIILIKFDSISVTKQELTFSISDNMSANSLFQCPQFYTPTIPPTDWSRIWSDNNKKYFYYNKNKNIYTWRLIKRRKGASPKGKIWDYYRGGWIPCDEKETGIEGITSRLNDNKKAKSRWFYDCVENETLEDVSKSLKIPLSELIHLNISIISGKLKHGTRLLLPKGKVKLGNYSGRIGTKKHISYHPKSKIIGTNITVLPNTLIRSEDNDFYEPLHACIIEYFPSYGTRVAQWKVKYDDNNYEYLSDKDVKIGLDLQCKVNKGLFTRFTYRSEHFYKEEDPENQGWFNVLKQYDDDKTKYKWYGYINSEGLWYSPLGCVNTHNKEDKKYKDGVKIISVRTIDDRWRDAEQNGEIIDLS